jgi:hypothetical protein
MPKHPTPMLHGAPKPLSLLPYQHRQIATKPQKKKHSKKPKTENALKNNLKKPALLCFSAPYPPQCFCLYVVISLAHHPF